jgi:hypothetical protein
MNKDRNGLKRGGANYNGLETRERKKEKRRAFARARLVGPEVLNYDLRTRCKAARTALSMADSVGARWVAKEVEFEGSMRK